MLAALAHLIAQFPAPDGGGLPDDGGGFRTSPTPFIVLFGLGFLIATAGHVYKSRTMVALGIMLIFLTTVAVPLALAFSN